MTVSDTNDHNPVLACPADAQLACTYRVPENTPTGTVIVNSITSSDQDTDPIHNTITYSISNSPTPPFDIHPVCTSVACFNHFYEI